MPKPRSIITGEDPSGEFHVVSRINGRVFCLGDPEREHFAKLLRAVETFSGVRVLTWAMLSNHFHIVLEVPRRPVGKAADGRPVLSEREFWRRLGALYSLRELRDLRQMFELRRDREQLRERFLARMWDLSEFMKTLKLRYSKWFNRVHGRRGTLWEERFRASRIGGRTPLVVASGDSKSSEPEGGALAMVCAYVDLNAVRAGLVDDPADYRWCGYGEAMGGRRAAREGLKRAWNCGQKRLFAWGRVRDGYRRFLYGISEEGKGKAEAKSAAGRSGGSSRGGRHGLTQARIVEAWNSGGKLTVPELLRCRLRFMTDGLVIGSREYLEDFLAANREAFGKNRASFGGKPTKGDWGGLCAFRRPQTDAVAPPTAGGAS